jgi:hypothetical protein
MRTLFLRANSRRVFVKKDEGEEFEECYLTKDLKLEVHEPKRFTEDSLFLLNEDFREKVKELKPETGLTIFRARNNCPLNTETFFRIIKGQNVAYFWNKRPDLDTSPACIELILIKLPE